jgi:hypothetical protein
MAVPEDRVIENIKHANSLGLKSLFSLRDWREGTPVALVGGGPSLLKHYHKLKDYKCVIACGSVHDKLRSLGIVPTYTVLCDPDPIMCSYVKNIHYTKTTYLVASQCSPEMFNHLKYARVILWHTMGMVDYDQMFGKKTLTIPGGCTVGTRAMSIAMGMGYKNLHLFGFDSCFEGDAHHAYEFQNPEVEKLEAVQEITMEDGTVYKMAGYHVAQFIDFQRMLTLYKNRMNVTVHGDGPIARVMEIARSKYRATRGK